MDGVRTLEEAGVTAALVAEPSLGTRPWRPDALLDVEGVRFCVEVKGRAPYPNELPGWLQRQREVMRLVGHPMLVLPYVSQSLGTALEQAGWSWVDGSGNFGIRAPGLLLRQRQTSRAPGPKTRGLPQGAGGLGIVRALIGFVEGEEEERGATALANQVGVSQPRASQVLGRLQSLGLVYKTDRGRLRPHREALLDAFLAEYKGPGGSEHYYYTLDAPSDVARTAVRVQRPHSFVVSADVGPDLVIGWRRPEVLVVYAREPFLDADLDLVAAQGPDDANVIVRYPGDPSVFPERTLVADDRGLEVPLAQPTQMIWDLQDLGGADRLEQAGVMRSWLLNP
jgi:hypothetical protein